MVLISVSFSGVISDSANLPLHPAVCRSARAERRPGVRAGAVVSDASREQCAAARDDFVAQHAVPAHTVCINFMSGCHLVVVGTLGGPKKQMFVSSALGQDLWNKEAAGS